MNKKRVSFYTVLLYLAYLFFLGFGAFWFYENLATEKHFNYAALGVIVVFLLQIIFRRRLVNLVLGILSLFFSIWMLMEVIRIYDLFAKNTTLDDGSKLLLAISVISIIMSGILIFSYQALNRENMENER